MKGKESRMGETAGETSYYRSWAEELRMMQGSVTKDPVQC